MTKEELIRILDKQKLYEVDERGRLIEYSKDSANPSRIYIDLFNLVMDLPSVDVQPVVRCSGCEHWDKGICYCDGYEIHCQDYYVGDMHTEPDFFCGFGKRKGADE